MSHIFGAAFLGENPATVRTQAASSVLSCSENSVVNRVIVNSVN